MRAGQVLVRLDHPQASAGVEQSVAGEQSAARTVAGYAAVTAPFAGVITARHVENAPVKP